MTTEVVKAESFEERMKSRIKESIGELITDEELSKLIKRGIEEVFFQEREVKKSRYSYAEPEFSPPLIHEIIKDLIGKTVESKISLWIDENNKEVIENINNTISLGLGSALMNAITMKFNTALVDFQINMENSLKGN